VIMNDVVKIMIFNLKDAFVSLKVSGMLKSLSFYGIVIDFEQ